MSDEHRDELPADLDVSGYVGQYTFPDIRRRRIPGIIYLTLAVGCLALWATHRGDDRVLVNHGTLVAGVALLLIGCYHVATAWPLAVRDTDALVAAVRGGGPARAAGLCRRRCRRRTRRRPLRGGQPRGLGRAQRRLTHAGGGGWPTTARRTRSTSRRW